MGIKGDRDRGSGKWEGGKILYNDSSTKLDGWNLHPPKIWRSQTVHIIENGLTYEVNF